MKEVELFHSLSMGYLQRLPSKEYSIGDKGEGNDFIVEESNNATSSRSFRATSVTTF